jgi:hypothetical protein
VGIDLGRRTEQAGQLQGLAPGAGAGVEPAAAGRDPAGGGEDKLRAEVLDLALSLAPGVGCVVTSTSPSRRDSAGQDAGFAPFQPRAANSAGHGTGRIGLQAQPEGARRT